ncbi:oxygenase MpaB family protein [Lentzea sp. BCCO 10_0856]|uniref:Oxygenase MpaB family protein n=1 Tax=Lentzea miocenica TaxID=3095431 RepID=A0ABU4T8W0_9PSEU|nr:oxygenase MpaB family protein [Lentzea sp. BCCO 10_0856]MDX8034610.1 oxygenase MpaB family protein [Lentzea sp. BCCO 10_0856]
MPDPNSVSWQMHADPTMWIAGIASLYLQALHPKAVAGVVQNSNFQADPLGRLKRTADFVGLGVYGTDQEIAAAAARVRATHRNLRGVVDGRTFRVDEPELLLWVHCSEVSCFETVLDRAGYGLTNRQKDQYYAEQRFAATLVGLHEDEVPCSRREMADYFERMRPELRRTADSDVIYDFLHGPPVQGWIRHGLPLYRVLVGHLAYSALPDWALELHGRPPYVQADRWLRIMRRAALLVPGKIRRLAPPGHLKRAIERHGRHVTPSKARLP